MAKHEKKNIGNKTKEEVQRKETEVWVSKEKIREANRGNQKDDVVVKSFEKYVKPEVFRDVKVFVQKWICSSSLEPVIFDFWTQIGLMESYPI